VDGFLRRRKRGAPEPFGATCDFPCKECARKGLDGAFEAAAGLANADAVNGVWLRVIHGDGSANGYRIEAIAKTPGGSRIRIHDEPGFQMTPNGMRMLFFPNYEIPGKQWIEICVPRFVAAGGGSVLRH